MSHACRETQDGWAMVESSHKTWSTGEGPMDQCHHSLPRTQEKTTHGHHQMANTKNRLTIFFVAKEEEALYSQQEQEWELTVAHIMNSLLQNSDIN